MDVACCHGNRYDVMSALKVLPNNRVAKIFIVSLHLTIILRNRAEYRLILSRRGRRSELAKIKRYSARLSRIIV